MRLRDPLSEVTRKERRLLLLLAILSLAVIRTGFLPTRVSALGIEFSNDDRAKLLWILAATTTYFLGAFVIYAASDFLNWRVALTRMSFRERLAEAEQELAAHFEGLKRKYEPRLSAAHARRQSEASERSESEEGVTIVPHRTIEDERRQMQAELEARTRELQSEMKLRLSNSRLFRMVAPMSFLRAVFEFLLPVLFGFYALGLLVTAMPAV